MDELDEDVVLEGSVLHEHLVTSGFTDIEVLGIENYKQGSLADEMIGNNRHWNNRDSSDKCSEE